MSPVVRSAAAHGQTAEHIVGHPRRLGLDPVAHADVGRIVALQAHRRFFFRHLQMAAEEFVSFFSFWQTLAPARNALMAPALAYQRRCASPALVVSVFQAGHELAADFRVLREQVTEMSGRARVIFGGSFAQQRQKGMQFCAGCAIINAVIQQEGSLCESLSKSELPHWRTRPGG